MFDEAHQVRLPLHRHLLERVMQMCVRAVDVRAPNDSAIAPIGSPCPRRLAT